jgi:hypothetical protein
MIKKGFFTKGRIGIPVMAKAAGHAKRASSSHSVSRNIVNWLKRQGMSVAEDTIVQDNPRSLVYIQLPDGWVYRRINEKDTKYTGFKPGDFIDGTQWVLVNSKGIPVLLVVHIHGDDDYLGEEDYEVAYTLIE